MVFTSERLLEVATESWLEWDSDHWSPFRGSNRLSYQAMSSTRTQSQLCTAPPISSLCSVFTFHFGHCLSAIAFRPFQYIYIERSKKSSAKYYQKRKKGSKKILWKVSRSFWKRGQKTLWSRTISKSPRRWKTKFSWV